MPKSLMLVAAVLIAAPLTVGSLPAQSGLVFSFAFFDHALGKDRTFQRPDGRTVTAGPVDPYTWEIAELLIEKGKIHRIEAVLTPSPCGMNSGRSSWEDGLSSRARDVTQSSAP